MLLGRTTWSDIECAPTLLPNNQQNLNEDDSDTAENNIIVKATRSIFVRGGNFKRKKLSEIKADDD